MIGAFAQEGGAQGRPVSVAVVDALGGGLAGRAAGPALSQRELRQALEAEYRALEYTPAGQTVAWGQSGSAPRGEVVAGAPYRVGSQNCRQYVHSLSVDGRAASARGGACRNEDGSWTPLG